MLETCNPLTKLHDKPIEQKHLILLLLIDGLTSQLLDCMRHVTKKVSTCSSVYDWMGELDGEAARDEERKRKTQALQAREEFARGTNKMSYMRASARFGASNISSFIRHQIPFFSSSSQVKMDLEGPNLFHLQLYVDHADTPNSQNEKNTIYRCEYCELNHW